VWSPANKFSHWRMLWTALAVAEQELGLDITDQQIEEMRNNWHTIDFDLADAKEREFRHDVMGHVHAFGAAAPTAMPVIHLGATSCYVGDNTDIIQLKQSLQLVSRKLLKVISVLSDFAVQHRAVATLGFTHYQPAQLTTVGKRATLWIQDFMMDWERVQREVETIPMRGVKGTTGTQASFLELFDGDHEKVRALNERVCHLMGFRHCVKVSGQTYTRKIDYYILSLLSGIAQSAYKMCGDVRLLANLKEVEEPFEKSQIGSSAMAYKRNPMRSERVCSLARYVMGLPDGAGHTHANQWLERTLDDSAIRRIILPEGFLAVDVILTMLDNIADGLHVWPEVVRSHVMAELPFMATENILMECTFAAGCAAIDRWIVLVLVFSYNMISLLVRLGQASRRAGTGRICTKRSASTPWQPGPSSRARASRTTCWSGSEMTKRSSRSMPSSTRCSTPTCSWAGPPSRWTSTLPTSGRSCRPTRRS
jgi:adenylosuccinate lyase